MSSPADLPASDWPYPISIGRLRAFAQAQGFAVTPVGRNGLRGVWGAYPFELAIRVGEVSVLQVRGSFAHPITAARESDLIGFANDWHREHIWPTVFWSSDAEDRLTVRTLYVADFSGGATDEQFAEAVNLGLATSGQCLRALTAAFGS
ncbi:YbjN domain-containing protein [Occultella glacieicola]|uniref:YbjN domain-containing protein n=1 Tax=Occultella glacieicola TaxID=2518684 RepID=A0ABY2E0J9_9MICO|nr:YbjN domain-containing protein [Occultella glacieicola]TDE90792.1 YbjN domain-containing protein [Occultella glacieicola]